jgi:hypothetical protein
MAISSAICQNNPQLIISASFLFHYTAKTKNPKRNPFTCAQDFVLSECEGPKAKLSSGLI